MKIEQFRELFKQNNPDGEVWPGSRFGKPGTVAVRFLPDGKIYHYRGTVVAVAERLGLIEDYDMMAEGKRIAIGLADGRKSMRGPAGVESTVREYLAGCDIWNRLVMEPDGVDEYGRDMMRFWLGEVPDWIKDDMEYWCERASEYEEEVAAISEELAHGKSGKRVIGSHRLAWLVRWKLREMGVFEDLFFGWERDGDDGPLYWYELKKVERWQRFRLRKRYEKEVTTCT